MSCNNHLELILVSDSTLEQKRSAIPPLSADVRGRPAAGQALLPTCVCAASPAHVKPGEGESQRAPGDQSDGTRANHQKV